MTTRIPPRQDQPHLPPPPPPPPPDVAAFEATGELDCTAAGLDPEQTIRLKAVKLAFANLAAPSHITGAAQVGLILDVAQHIAAYVSTGERAR